MIKTKCDVEFITIAPGDFPTYIDQIGQLRISVFSEFPYLYDGQLQYERDYLVMYAKSQEASLVIAEVNGEVIGATLGLPLKDSFEDCKKPFIKQEESIDDYYYLGEILLQKNYRGFGVGRALYEEFEKALAHHNGYKKLTFCHVIRPENHPECPKDYFSLEEFWRNRGYHIDPHLMGLFEWKEIGGTKPIRHPMSFWSKEIV